MQIKDDWKKQLPLWATLSRIFLCPPLMALMFMDAVWARWAAMFLFIAASITDWLDGHLARKYGVESTMGKLMDPVADKVLVSTALVMLVWFKRVDPVMVSLLLARDSLIGGVRSVAAAQNIIIAAKPFGKWKTGFQMVGIPALILDIQLLGLPVREIGYACLWISVILSLVSGYQYCYGYFIGRPR